jgi:hypothetical protein
MRSLGVLMFAGILAGLACADEAAEQEEEAEGVLCTAEFRFSTLVTVLNGETPVDDAAVEYSVDGSDPSACDAFGTQYACGGEEAGDFLITATRGEQSGSVAVTVEEDECHVIPQEVTLRLEPETDEDQGPIRD